jgi:hypothetical protein
MKVKSPTTNPNLTETARSISSRNLGDDHLESVIDVFLLSFE